MKEDKSKDEKNMTENYDTVWLILFVCAVLYLLGYLFMQSISVE